LTGRLLLNLIIDSYTSRLFVLPLKFKGFKIIYVWNYEGNCLIS